MTTQKVLVLLTEPARFSLHFYDDLFKTSVA